MTPVSISHVPPGSQDLLSDDVRRRRFVQASWFTLAERSGYEEVMPPTFEYEEVFTRGAGDDLSSRLLRFVDQDGRLVALRADFTSSIARLASTKLAQAPLPLRLSYAGKVFRQEPEGGGRRRELFQLGAELIGDASADADVEVLRLVIGLLSHLGVADFQINLGEIEFIRSLLARVPENATALGLAIDRKDRPALLEHARRGGWPEGTAEVLVELPELIGRGDVLDRAGALALDDGGRSAIRRLREIDQLLSDEERAHVVYDLGESRGLGYYTGIQFEVFVAGVGRAIGFGGRYDRLLALYGVDRPAVGFALETDELADLLATAR